VALLDVTVNIEGEDYTGATLGSCRISRGREGIDVEARAGYALLELIDTTGNGFPFDVTDTVTVTIEDTSGPVPLFTGTISNINSALYAVRTGTRAIWQVMANGPLALAARRQVLQAGTGQEQDGDLALEILREGLRMRWEDYRGGTWAQAGDVTWAEVDPGFDPDLIEQPGEYAIAPLPAQDEGYNALGLISQVAASVGGTVFETGTGGVGYLSAYGRSELAAAGFTQLPTSQIAADPLRTGKAASDMINRLEVRWDAGVIERSDTASISRYGIRTSVLDTLLALEDDARERAEDLLFDRAVPRFVLPSVQFALHTLETAQVDNLISVDVNTPVETARLPRTLGQLPTRMFVEGIQYDLGAERRTVTLFVSDAQLSLRSERWADVEPTLAWEDVSATLEWADARRITV
jgi:hypothetical protein